MSQDLEELAVAVLRKMGSSLVDTLNDLVALGQNSPVDSDLPKRALAAILKDDRLANILALLLCVYYVVKVLVR